MSLARLLLFTCHALALIACQFDPAGINLSPDGGSPSVIDARLDADGAEPAVDAMPAQVPWHDNDWEWRRSIVIHADGVEAPAGGALSEYPLLVDLSGYALQARADGHDFLFTAADGQQQLDHEIEYWVDADDHLVAWVAIPSLSSTADTTIYLYGGNANADDQSAARDVWDDGFHAVWHMSEMSTSNINDVRNSTRNMYHLTSFEMEVDDLKDARIGQGLDFDGDDEFTDTGVDIDISGNDSFTMEAWVLPGDNSRGAYGSGICTWGFPGVSDRANFLYYHSDEQAFEVGFWANDDQTPGDYPKEAWYHVVNSYDGTTQRVYVNGQLALTRTPGPLDMYNDWYYVGVDSFDQGRYFEGLIDEVRISDVARTTEWIVTTYRNHENPATFYTVGSEQSRP